MSGFCRRARCNEATPQPLANSLAAASSSEYRSSRSALSGDRDIELGEQAGFILGATSEIWTLTDNSFSRARTLSSFAAVCSEARNAWTRAALLRASSASLWALMMDASSMNFRRAASFSERNSRIVKSWLGGTDIVCIVCYGKNWVKWTWWFKEKERMDSRH